jgi:hypothetical protein
MKTTKTILIVALISNTDYAFSDEVQKEICVYSEQDEKYQLDKESLVNYLFLKSGISLNCLPYGIDEENSLLVSKMYALDGKPSSKKCVFDKKEPQNISTSYSISLATASTELISILTTLGLDENSQIRFRESIYDPHRNIPPTNCTIKKEVENGSKKNLPALFIRESVDEIPKQMKDSKGAIISLSEDANEGNKTRMINGVIGLQWSKGELLFGSDTIRTFFGVNRTSKIVKKEQSQEDQVMETSLGVQLEKSVFDVKAIGNQAGWWVSSMSILATSEQYEDSLVTDIEYTGTLGLSAAKENLVWFDDWRGVGAFLIKPNLQLKLIYGHVNDQGDSENLRDSEEYIRLGPSTGFTIAGNRSWNERLVFDARYTYFDIHNSPLDRSENVKIILSYFLDKDERFAITYSYENGKTGVNLNEVDKWNLGIAYKY